MKKLFILSVSAIAIITVVAGLFFVINKNKSEGPDIIGKGIGDPYVDMCYQYSKPTASGLTDKAWLKMIILDDDITGEYQNLPAEKDSKIGPFSGTVGPMDPSISARTADVWWNSMAEGMAVTEQLKIQFGEGSAVALFGEMVDRGDGRYVYKEGTSLTGGFQMSQIDCEYLDDMVIVEKYIRENIKTLAPEKPVMGGSWYVLTVDINPLAKTGTMTYEDGHIQGKATFMYTLDKDQAIITAVKSM